VTLHLPASSLRLHDDGRSPPGAAAAITSAGTAASPSAPPATVASAAPPPPAPAARPDEAILLVEDNDEVRRLGIAALESLGYRVLHAATGAAALALLADARTGRIDLLFTDVVLPGGMSGLALADQVATLRPGLPLLFATGYSATGRESRSAGPPDPRMRTSASDALPESVPASNILRKPDTIDTLAHRCRQAIDSAADSG
jgi:CheY-like chemotaxis protein